MDNNNNNNNINKLAYGFQNKDCAYNYRNGRPSYPKESVDYLKALGLNNDSVIVDIGGGTGKFTEVMVKEGFNNVTIVEPSIGFCNEANLLLTEIKNDKFPSLNFKILNETSTSISISSNSVDCVICAHSFHWFSNLESIKEISRILKPNGILAIIWNKPDKLLNSSDLLKDIVQLYKNPYYNESINGRNSPTALLLENWDNIFKEIKLDSNLHYLINTDLIYSGGIKYNEITNGDRIIAYSLSQSYISLLPINKKEKFINDLKLNLENNKLTNNGKQFEIIYNTEIYYTRKPSSTTSTTTTILQ